VKKSAREEEKKREGKERFGEGRERSRARF
jgi:hypothetical protein